jgi:two-component sensor histidine kinase
VRGGFGLFLGEVLANAVRHGTPGSVPCVTVTCDRVRQELTFVVENETDAAVVRVLDGETYGGMAILKAMARLFEWLDLTFEVSQGHFVVRWRVPVSDRGVAGNAD